MKQPCFTRLFAECFLCAVAGEYRPAEMDAVESFFCWSMFVFCRSEAGAATDRRAAMERKQPIDAQAMIGDGKGRFHVALLFYRHLVFTCLLRAVFLSDPPLLD